MIYGLLDSATKSALNGTLSKSFGQKLQKLAGGEFLRLFLKSNFTVSPSIDFSLRH
jgi:hypothetical protein